MVLLSGGRVVLLVRFFVTCDVTTSTNFACTYTTGGGCFDVLLAPPSPIKYDNNKGTYAENFEEVVTNSAVRNHDSVS